MSPATQDPNLNALWARAVAEELSRGGARHAVIAPGSRSAPLALALAGQLDMRCWSVLDERSAAFFALGLAKGSREPTVVLATSGTAGAHFYPALIEAAQAGVPVIFITADRPPELHGFGALQTIPQGNLFGRFPRAAFDLGVPEATDSSLLHLRALTALAMATACDRPGGPVHLNFPFREPLAPTPLAFGAEKLSALAVAGRTGRPLTRIIPIPSEPASEALDELGKKLERAERGLIVCGAREVWDGLPREIALLGQLADYPILAEAASQLRFEADGPQTIAHYEAILRSQEFCSTHRPDLILRFGGTLISKALQRFIDDAAEQGAEVITFSEGRILFDPAHHSSTAWTSAVAPICRRLNARLAGSLRKISAWAEEFREADRRAASALEHWLAEKPWPSEPALARALARAMPERANLFVASSMPARDLDAFVPAGPRLRVYANRGVNGIDGLISTALGVSAASQRPTAALLGDLALLHDLSGLVLARRHRIPLTLVVPNNDGGGIFSFLPIAEFPQHFEELFAAPQGIDLAHCATLCGARLHRPETAAAFEATLRESFGGGLHLVEVRTRRDENVIAHRELYEAMVAAVASA
jgi:2-succinyl-5-enolpyruvyl-6-hydroxy-3-cyclohexene-1-carboxylate synthase